MTAPGTPNRTAELLQQIAQSSEAQSRAYMELEQIFPGRGIIDRHNEPAIKLLELYRDVLRIAAGGEAPRN